MLDDMDFRKSTFEYCVHKGWEHIEWKYHPNWEIVWCGDVMVTVVASMDNQVDLFTKTF